ncbi:hypothetical protein [Pseudalkalibacillus decolorationis]|uniref:hypothetical protein n=1 Tax=Pseudalkalibacillus decolorationis TaxID=163879 RepID=UPI0021485862|nr:hypothetical protein [Pseudalkalibacillus decolorationis]
MVVINRINLNRSSYLAITDQPDDPRLQSILEELKTRKKTFQTLVYSQPTNKVKLKKALLDQTIGCYLLIGATPINVREIVQTALEYHFTHLDMFIFEDEPSVKHVFCGCCHFIHDNVEASRFVCKNCGQLIEVSDHFSHYYHAVLGFPNIQ